MNWSILSQEYNQGVEFFMKKSNKFKKDKIALTYAKILQKARQI